MLYYYYYYFLRPTSTKLQAEILKLNNVNNCNDISFGDHSILEGDRIPPLKSHGQALDEELCFPGVLSDNSDAPANLLRHFYGCLMPCTCCLDYYYTCHQPRLQRDSLHIRWLSCQVTFHRHSTQHLCCCWVSLPLTPSLRVTSKTRHGKCCLRSALLVICT